MKRRIVCAACKHADGKLVLGVRHWDGLMAESAAHLGRSLPWQWDKHVQGFVDNAGAFLDRYEAFTVAKDAGQLHPRFDGQTDVELFSEDLY